MTEIVKSPDYVLLDLDRTLLNTEAAMLSYLKLVGRHNANLANRLYWAWRQTEEAGESFNTRAYLAEEVTMERVQQGEVNEFDELFARFSSADDSLLNDGAVELLKGLADHQVPHGILTYGSADWQEAKLCASGLSTLPHIVTQQRAKGRVVTSWVRSNGEIKLPRVLIDRYKVIGGKTLSSIMLVDDKLEALVGLPDMVTGYWYTDKELKSEVVVTSETGEYRLGIISDLRQVLDNV